MLHVRELVGQHAFELIVGQNPEDALGRGNRGVLRAAPSRERVRGQLRNDVAARHRQTRALRQSPDRFVEAIAGTHFLRTIHAQHDLVGPPVRHEVGDDGEEEADDHALRAAERLAEKHQHRS